MTKLIKRCCTWLIAAGLAMAGASALAESTNFFVDQSNNNLWHVANGSGLAEFATAVNGGTSFEGKTVMLDADIDLAAYDNWMPIGTTAFKGTFDGNHKTIENLKITSGGTVGLFGKVEGATIKDVIVKGSVNATGDYAGLVVGMATGVVMSAVSTYGTLVGAGDYTGGIIGRTLPGAAASVVDCTNNVAVTVDVDNTKTGGIVGNAKGTGAIERCVNKGAIVGSIAGGITGYSMDCSIIDCVNEGTVTEAPNSEAPYSLYGFSDADSRGAGGIVASAAGNTLAFIANCCNKGVVSGKARAAGIVANLLNVNQRAKSCLNLGAVTCDKLAGGINCCCINSIPGSGEICVDQCVNMGSVTSTGNSEYAKAAGIMSEHNGGRGSLGSCYNQGVVTAVNGTAHPIRTQGSPLSTCYARDMDGFIDSSTPPNAVNASTVATALGDIAKVNDDGTITVTVAGNAAQARAVDPTAVVLNKDDKVIGRYNTIPEALTAYNAMTDAGTYVMTVTGGVETATVYELADQTIMQAANKIFTLKPVDGQKVTFKYANGKYGIIFAIYGDSNYNTPEMTIQGFTFDVTDEGAANAIHLLGDKDAYTKDKGYATGSRYCSHFTARDCSFKANGGTVAAFYSTSGSQPSAIKLINCTAENVFALVNGYIDNRAGFGLIAENCHVDGCDGFINQTDNPGTITVTGCTANTRGIAVRANSDLVISGCAFTNSSPTAEGALVVVRKKSNVINSVKIENTTFTALADTPVIHDFKNEYGSDLSITVNGMIEGLMFNNDTVSVKSGAYYDFPAAAQIGDQTYGTLAEAFAAVKDGETITILNDCYTPSSYALMNMLALTANNVTLDLNKKAVTTMGNFSVVIAGNNVTVTNGTINAGPNAAKTTKINSYALALGSKESGSKVTGIVFADVTVHGGIAVGCTPTSTEYHGGAEVSFRNCDITSGDFYCIYGQANSDVLIESGKYYGAGDNHAIEFESGTFKLKGGIYSSFTSPTAAEGYVIVDNDDPATKEKYPKAVIFPIAEIGTKKFATLKGALDAVKPGETIQLLATTIEEGQIVLPATLKNVTIKGAAGYASIVKNTRLLGTAGVLDYQGLTVEGIDFENSGFYFVGDHAEVSTLKDIVYRGNRFRNFVDTDDNAPIQFNVSEASRVVNFTFENNVIDGTSGSSSSGVGGNFISGNITITGNKINNVAFRPLCFGIADKDSIADVITITGNTFSGSQDGRLQVWGNGGTDNVTFVINNNIFKGITNKQQICCWGFNSAKTVADFTGNYYDQPVDEARIYWQSGNVVIGDTPKAAKLPHANNTYFNYYAALNPDGTIDTTSKVQVYVPVAMIDDKEFVTMADAFAAVQDGDTIKVLKSGNVVTDYEKNIGDEGYGEKAGENRLVFGVNGKFVLDLNGKELCGRINFTKGDMTVSNGTIRASSQALNIYGSKAYTEEPYTTITLAADAVVRAGYGLCIFGGDPSNGMWPLGFGETFNVYGKVYAPSPVFVSGNVGMDNYTDNIVENQEIEGIKTAQGKSISQMMLEHGPVINIYEGAELGSTSEAGSTDDSPQGISMQGCTTVNVYGGKIYGAEAIGVKGGCLNVYGGTLLGKGPKCDPVAAINSGTESSGGAISVSTSYNANYPIIVNVTGGTVESVNNAAFLVAHSYKNGNPVAAVQGIKVKVAGGKFVGGYKQNAILVENALESDAAVWPAKFISAEVDEQGEETGYPLCSSEIPEEYIADSYMEFDNHNGTWTVTGYDHEVKVEVKEDLKPVVEPEEGVELTAEQLNTATNQAETIKNEIIAQMEKPIVSDVIGTGIQEATFTTNDVGKKVLQPLVVNAVRDEAVSNLVEAVYQNALAQGASEALARQTAEKSRSTITTNVNAAVTEDSATNSTTRVELKFDDMCTRVTTNETADVVSTLSTIEFDIKPIVTTVTTIETPLGTTNITTRTHLPVGVTLANPITFSLPLGKDFPSDFVTLIHTHDNGFAETNTYKVAYDDDGSKVLWLTWNKFSIALASAVDLSGFACWVAETKDGQGEVYETVKEAIKDMTAGTKFQIWLLKDCQEEDLALGANQTLYFNGHQFTGSIKTTGDNEVVTSKGGESMYVAPAAIAVSTGSGSSKMNIRGYTFPSEVDTPELKKAYLEETVASGFKRWQAYILGDTAETMKLTPEIVGATEAGPWTVVIKAHGDFVVDTPEKSGVAVKFNLVMRKEGEQNYTPVQQGLALPYFQVDIGEINMSKTYWKIQTVFQSTEAE